MVKKLFKHEFFSIFRSMFPIECIVLGMGIITRIIAAFENDTTVYAIISFFSMMMLTVACFVGPIAAIVFGVVRFYKNMFTQEGYLTLTLPVSATEHIFVKATVASIFHIVAVVIAFISFCIAASGDLLTESFKAAGYLFDRLFEFVKPTHVYFYIAEFILLLLVSIIHNYLLYYACICIGQRARKHRVLLAFGIYYLYYIITQVVATVFSIIFAIIQETRGFENLMRYFENHVYGCIHGLFIFFIVLIAILAGVYFFISSNIIRKKINLE